MDAAKPKLDAAKKAEEARKTGQETNLDAARKNEEGIFQAWEAGVQHLVEQVKKTTVDEQIKTWGTEEAYVTDAFRILANKQLCMQCHQIGKTPNTNQIQGPPLYLSYQRLRPGWLERWIATPQRFLTYTSPCRIISPWTSQANTKNCSSAPRSSKSSAVRDVLMAYPRVTALPINHYWALPLPSEAKLPPANQETTRNDTLLPSPFSDGSAVIIWLAPAQSSRPKRPMGQRQGQDHMGRQGHPQAATHRRRGQQPR